MIVITGSAGFIGSYLIQKLNAEKNLTFCIFSDKCRRPLFQDSTVLIVTVRFLFLTSPGKVPTANRWSKRLWSWPPAALSRTGTTRSTSGWPARSSRWPSTAAARARSTSSSTPSWTLLAGDRSTLSWWEPRVLNPPKLAEIVLYLVLAPSQQVAVCSLVNLCCRT